MALTFGSVNVVYDSIAGVGAAAAAAALVGPSIPVMGAAFGATFVGRAGAEAFVWANVWKSGAQGYAIYTASAAGAGAALLWLIGRFLGIGGASRLLLATPIIGLLVQMGYQKTVDGSNLY